MLKYTLKVLIPLTIIFVVGCTGKSPIPQNFVADLDEIRPLTDEEIAENVSIDISNFDSIYQTIKKNDIISETKPIINIGKLAIAGGWCAITSTLGVLGSVSRKYAHKIPFILNLNHNEFF